MVAVLLPSGDLAAHRCDSRDATLVALAVEGAQFDFGDVDPTAMF